MGGCQNYGPFLGTLNIRGRIIIGTPKRTIILTKNTLNGATCTVMAVSVSAATAFQAQTWGIFTKVEFPFCGSLVVWGVVVWGFRVWEFRV